jgi:predicted TPR repeat methyltransferase
MRPRPAASITVLFSLTLNILAVAKKSGSSQRRGRLFAAQMSAGSAAYWSEDLRGPNRPGPDGAAAVLAFERALRVEPSSCEAMHQLSSVLLFERKEAEAESHLDAELALRRESKCAPCPARWRCAHLADALFQMGNARLQRGHFVAAGEAYEEAIHAERGLKRASALAAHVLAALAAHALHGRFEPPLSDAALGPTTSEARWERWHDVASDAARRFVAQHFDDFSPDFDATLVNKLQYRAPSLIARAVAKSMEARGILPADARKSWLTVDYGAGTGLLSTFLRTISRKLVGVDLSPRMLDVALSTGRYDTLVVGGVEKLAALAEEDDLRNVQRATPGRFEGEKGAVVLPRPGEAALVVAADVLVYLGNVSSFMRAAARSLAPGGLLALTAESMEALAQAGGEPVSEVDVMLGWRLKILKGGGRGRFCHARAYLESAGRAEGLAILSHESAILRTEKSRPVSGHVMVFEKRAGAGEL